MRQTGGLDLEKLSNDETFFEEIRRYCKTCLKGESKEFCDRESCLIHFIVKQYIDRIVYYQRGILEGIRRVDYTFKELKDKLEEVKSKIDNKNKKKAKKSSKKTEPPKMAGSDKEEVEDGEEEKEEG